MQPLRTIFMGTPEFAVPSLQSLIIDDYFDIIAVITQTDKKVGRKQIVTPSPIKQLAIKNNIDVLQPLKVRDIVDEINKLSPDIIVVVAYGQIIPESILNMPKFGCINVHGSLLPLHRGAACIQAAIMNGDLNTGVTIMKMDKGLDTGPIITQAEIEISQTDDTGTLHDKLSVLGANTLNDTIKDYVDNKIQPVNQDNSKATYIGLLKKNDGRINWSWPAEKIERFIRAMSPWPGAWTTIDDQTLIIKKAQISANDNDGRSGEIALVNNDLIINCGESAIKVLELQLAGKKNISAKDFLLGHKDFVGKILV